MRRAWGVVLVIAIAVAIGAWLLLARASTLGAPESDPGSVSERDAGHAASTPGGPASRSSENSPVVAAPFRELGETGPGGPILVRVVDEAARPVAGVRALLVRRASNGEACCVAASPESSATGRADITPSSDSRSCGLSDGAWIVTVDVPLTAPPEIPVDPARPPGDPIVLAIGATGRAKVVIVDDSEKPVLERCEVTLQAVSKTPGVAPYALPAECRRSTVLGVVTFERVGVGTDVFAEVNPAFRRYPSISTRAGPADPRDEVTLRVIIDVTRPFVAGRLLDAGHEPLRDATRLQGAVMMVNESFRRTNTFPIATDSEGRFRAEILEDFDGGTRSLEIRLLRRPDQVTAAATIDLSKPLPLGTTDVGDVTLAAVPLPALIASGMVVDEAGRPVGSAGIRLWGRLPSDASVGTEPRWDDVPELDHLAPSDDEGRFEIRGRCEIDRFRIQADKRDFWSDDPVEFDPGATEVRLVLHRAGAIAGNLLMPEGLRPGDVAMCVRREGSDPNQLGARGSGRWGQPQADGRFSFESLQRGSFTVMFQRGDNGESIAEFGGVVVEPGVTTRDPRLQNLVLPLPRQILLTVVDAAGSSLPADAVVLGERPGVVPQVLRAQSGRIRLLIRGSTCDVLLAAPGYRRTLLKSIDADRQVVLEKGPALRVLFADDAVFPKGEGIAFSVWLSAAGRPENSSDLRPADLVGSSGGGHFLSEARAAAFSVSEPGRYLLRLFMTINRDEIHGAEEVFAQPVTVADTSSEQVFSLPVTKAAIDAAIRKIETH